MANKNTILYVDDDEINRQLFEINFGSKYSIITADDGVTGLHILSNNDDIAIVLSDLNMPQMSGLEFIHEIKKKHPHVGCFVLTGYEMTREVHTAIQSGLVINHFKKPFDMRSITDAIDLVLQ